MVYVEVQFEVGGIFPYSWRDVGLPEYCVTDILKLLFKFYVPKNYQDNGKSHKGFTSSTSILNLIAKVSQIAKMASIIYPGYNTTRIR